MYSGGYPNQTLVFWRPTGQCLLLVVASLLVPMRQKRGKGPGRGQDHRSTKPAGSAVSELLYRESERSRIDLPWLITSEQSPPTSFGSFAGQFCGDARDSGN